MPLGRRRAAPPIQFTKSVGDEVAVRFHPSISPTSFSVVMPTKARFTCWCAASI